MTNWLFDFRNKQDVSIHTSWLSDIILALVRIIGLTLIVLRFAIYAYEEHNFKYLTFYGFVLTLIYFGTVVIDLIVCKLLIKKQTSLTKFTGNIINIIYEVTFSIELTITLLYWILLYNPIIERLDFSNFGMHLIPFLMLAFDFIFNSYQFPIRHFIITFIIAGIYLIINKVNSCSGKPVYSVFPCENVGLIFGAIFVFALGHAIGHLFWRFCRSKKIDEVLKNSEENVMMETLNN